MFVCRLGYGVPGMPVEGGPLCGIGSLDDVDSDIETSFNIHMDDSPTGSLVSQKFEKWTDFHEALDGTSVGYICEQEGMMIIIIC